MSNNLHQAAHQWATRPDDERFASLEELAAATRVWKETAEQSVDPFKRFQVIDIGPDGRALPAPDQFEGPGIGPKGEKHDTASNLAIVGRDDKPAILTHWAFSQICQRMGAPADYLRGLPAHAVGQLLTYHLGGAQGTANILTHSAAGGDGASLTPVCRSITTDAYARIWNCEIAERLAELGAYGWRVPPARPARAGQRGTRLATAADVLTAANHPSLGIREGMEIAPAGLYASDHDLFALLINEERNVADGSNGGLFRGIMLHNSEVGDGALWACKFMFRSVCGNHIIWDARDVQEWRLVHRGKNDRRFRWQFTDEIRRYADQSGVAEEQKIAAARRFQIGSTRQEVLDVLFKERVLPKKALESAYDLACREADYTIGDDPKTAWGFAQGITRLSQEVAQYADRRHEIDRAAGRVLHLAF